MLEKFAQDVSTALQAEKQIAVPWEMIVELILEMVERCFPSPNQENDFLAAARSPTILQRAALNVIARRVTSLLRAEAKAVAESLVHTAAQQKDDDLRAAHDECCAALGRCPSG